MSVSKPVLAFKDSLTFILDETDLTEKELGEHLETFKRDIPFMNGVRWWVDYHPAGDDEDAENYLSLYLRVNRTLPARFTFRIDNSSIQYDSYTFNVTEDAGRGCPRFASHNELRPLFADGQLSVICDVEFDVSVPFTFLAPRLVQHCDHIPTDFLIVVGSRSLPVHKSLLLLMSPAFHAMLSHDTAEIRRGYVKIKDFDFETVKAAVDFCYGREMETPSVETVVGMLRFADKYDIKGVTDLLKHMPRISLSNETFHTLVRYAYDCSKDDLFDGCCLFFENNQSEIVAMEEFQTHPLSLVTRLLRETFDLVTEFDVLRHAHANGIDFILEPLEQPIFESLSLGTFCNVVDYAWSCSRIDLKRACANLFNDYSAEICKMSTFVNLSSEVALGVMKLRCELFLSDQ